MRKWREDILTSQAIIRAAFPKDTAKLVTRALGCSDRQGKSIASGKVPGRFRAALIRVLDLAIAKNLAVLQHHQAALKAETYEEMVARSAGRRASSDRQAPATAARQDRQP